LSNVDGLLPEAFCEHTNKRAKFGAISQLTFENSFQQGPKVKNDLDDFANSLNVKIMFLK